MSRPSPKRRSHTVQIVLTIILSVTVAALSVTAVLLGTVRQKLEEQSEVIPAEPTDPTSATEAEASAPSPDDEDAALAYYQEMYEEFCEDCADASAVRYDYYDLDGDGIDELFLSEGDFHMARVALYSYFDGHGVQVDGMYGSYGEVRFSEDTGLLIDVDTAQGYYTRVDLSYDRGVLTTEFYCSDNEGAVNGSDAAYSINGEIVSADVYHAALERRPLLERTILLGRTYKPQ
ncbi:MAG: hypothetical protein K5695_10655 [Oscillospiraceae bacterium]|nr:hypothetical protein [Oscillospiraceae bacterium]